MPLPQSNDIDEWRRDSTTVTTLFRRRTLLPGLCDHHWTSSLTNKLEQFSDSSAEGFLVLFMTADENLAIEISIEKVFADENPSELFYFIKSSSPTGDAVTVQNFCNRVQYGSLKAPYLDTLLQLLTSVYGTVITRNRQLPSYALLEFSVQLESFLASVTATHSKLNSKHLQLYTPAECSHLQTIPGDQITIKRLEGVLLEWGKQLVSLLSFSRDRQSASSQGPFDELAFWAEHRDTLMHIQAQVRTEPVLVVIQVLRKAKSFYSPDFDLVLKDLEKAVEEAQSICAFLSILEEPCQILHSSPLHSLPAQFPKLLSLVRIIWTNSPHYNSSEKITGLLQMIGFEIIQNCGRNVPIDLVFQFQTSKSDQALNNIIGCCKAWKTAYHRAQELHLKSSSTPWNLDSQRIFVFVDAFLQRCEQLIEVGQCGFHFGRWLEGTQRPSSFLRGPRGVRIRNRMDRIEEKFALALSTLEQQKDLVLQVDKTQWSEHYQRFRYKIRELDSEIQATINSEFESIKSVKEALDFLKVFNYLRGRKDINATLIQKTRSVYDMFDEEMEKVRSEICKKDLPRQPGYTNFAGTAFWLGTLSTYHKDTDLYLLWVVNKTRSKVIVRIINIMFKTRLEQNWSHLEEARSWIPDCGKETEVVNKYKRLISDLQTLKKNAFLQWEEEVEKSSPIRMDTPVLCYSLERSGMIEVNIDRKFLNCLNEIRYWQRFNYEIPSKVVNIWDRQKELLILFKNVKLLVHSFNRTVAWVSPEEKVLFRKNFAEIENSLTPGLKTFTWLSKETPEFVATAQAGCQKLYYHIELYKKKNAEIFRLCEVLSEGKAFEMKHQEMGHEEFLQKKNIFFKEREKNVESVTSQINEILAQFRESLEDKTESNPFWSRYVQKIEGTYNDALQINIEKIIAGVCDDISEESPFFKIKPKKRSVLELEGRKVYIKPCYDNLGKLIMDFFEELRTKLHTKLTFQLNV